MILFGSNDKLRRKANLCHLLVSNISDAELIDNYGYNKDEIAQAKSDLPKFDDFAYLRGNIKRAFKK